MEVHNYATVSVLRILHILLSRTLQLSDGLIHLSRKCFYKIVTRVSALRGSNTD